MTDCVDCGMPGFQRASDMAVSVRAKDCPDCGGSGRHYASDPRHDDHACPTCEGTGVRASTVEADYAQIEARTSATDGKANEPFEHRRYWDVAIPDTDTIKAVVERNDPAEIERLRRTLRGRADVVSIGSRVQVLDNKSFAFKKGSKVVMVGTGAHEDLLVSQVAAAVQERHPDVLVVSGRMSAVEENMANPPRKNASTRWDSPDFDPATVAENVLATRIASTVLLALQGSSVAAVKNAAGSWCALALIPAPETPEIPETQSRSNTVCGQLATGRRKSHRVTCANCMGVFRAIADAGKQEAP